jgi:4-hydroxy-2-oxoheptanedioate aldolase
MAMTMKAKLAEPGRLLNGHVCVIPSAVVSQAIAAAGADYLIIDQEHSPMNQETLHAMIAATQGTDCAALVRIPEIGEANVKRAMDAGAGGICFPWYATSRTRSVASPHLAAFFPKRRRGWGPFVSHSAGRESAGYRARFRCRCFSSRCPRERGAHAPDGMTWSPIRKPNARG